MQPTILQAPRLTGAIDSATGLILPALDRFIELEDIKRNNGRDLTPKPVTGIVTDPNPEQVISLQNDAKERKMKIQNALSLSGPLVIGGLLVIGGIAAFRLLGRK